MPSNETAQVSPSSNADDRPVVGEAESPPQRVAVIPRPSGQLPAPRGNDLAVGVPAGSSKGSRLALAVVVLVACLIVIPDKLLAVGAATAFITAVANLVKS